MRVKDVYSVREPNLIEEWYTVVIVYDGHMDTLPYIYKKDVAEEKVTELKRKAGLEV